MGPSSSSSNNYNKERSGNSSKSRYDDRKSYDQRRDDRRDEKRINDERRSDNNGTYNDKRGTDYRKTNDYHEKKEYRNNDDRNGSSAQRSSSSYYQDRSSTGSYRPNSKYSLDRREENERKYEASLASGHTAADSPNKKNERNSSQRDCPNETVSSRPDESKSTLSPSQSAVGGGDIVEKKVLPSARNFEALLSLPLSETAPKQPNVVTVPPIATKPDGESSSTALTVQLPSYYNPKVINPNKYAEQIQKRKLIWGAKKTEDAASKWGHAQFSQDSDGKVASKFMRLMGIKNAPTESNPPEGNEKKADATSSNTNPDFKSREAMFSTMEQQYEVARQVTHTMRGVGLGFSSQTRPY